MRNLNNMKINYDFALTTYCQARCRSCARTEQDTGNTNSWLATKHMDLEVFTRIVSNSKNIAERNGYIQFCGELGDPMMHPQVSDFIDVALLYGKRVHINTNGGLRQPKWYKHLADTYKERIRIKFGIDGTDHDTNWLYREGVDWKRAMDNMRAYFGAQGEGDWHFIIFDWNWQQIPLARKMAEDIGCEVHFKFNTREYGKITKENKIIAKQLLEEVDGTIEP
jgi:MoaA/NifB/PqqE/SkfB family radical SAM enzyme